MYSRQYFLQIVVIISGIIISGVHSAAVENVEDESTNSSGFYIETEHKANWFQAWNNCSTKHMQLVSLDTKEKTEIVTAELRKVFGSNHPNIWIGGNDNAKTRHFVWMASDQPFGYANWAPGQPDNKRGVEHCVMLWEDHNYRWNDGNCLAKVAYVCEKKTKLN